MKIEVGKHYKNGHGEKVFAGYVVNNKPTYRVVGSLMPYYVDEFGRHTENPDSKLNLTAEWSIIDELTKLQAKTGDSIKFDLNEQRKINIEDQSKLLSDYSKLRDILDRAYEQAASGKGKERHANGKPFDKQPISEIGRMVGTGYNLGQAMKKAQEAQGMANRNDKDKAAHELLGAINYIASAIMLIEEE